NIYEMSEDERRAAGIDSLPEDLHEAIGIADASELLRETLGDHVLEYLVRNKREEWDAYKAYVTPFELERYLPLL
ncbi:MAG: glutamine synthetase, partial [Actinobacteria bacterium]|nr:glutamine synthetase [Actinomycetota bacterium]